MPHGGGCRTSSYSRPHACGGLMILGSDSAAEVDHGQRTENECLEQSAEDGESHKRQRHDYWKKPKENCDDQLFSHDVCKETNGERGRPCDMTDQLDWHHQR